MAKEAWEKRDKGEERSERTKDMSPIQRKDMGLDPMRGFILSILGGGALGGLAVFVDEARLPSRIFVTLFSTGLSWGAAAVVTGFVSRTRLLAAAYATVTLLAAAIAYYAINAWFGLRETSANALSMAAVAWGAAALCGGPILGVLGWNLRFGDRKTGAVAVGVLSGLLLGQGLRWAIRYGLALDPVFTPALVVPLLIFLVGLRNRPVVLALLGLIAGAVTSTAAWAMLERIR